MPCSALPDETREAALHGAVKTLPLTFTVKFPGGAVRQPPLLCCAPPDALPSAAPADRRDPPRYKTPTLRWVLISQVAVE